ncbi:hypothetical protein COV93_07565 [Candidatus Woesearchaeota archaeon CG11_big_fil_rev_8_21_14_0_20_43_8]|nr:MAG: hypothetical protein COV93_07565 [Candidatus Woesearchaeota archaeon CG11_big_fil_rev_8_21_14_0_20_43_8]
MDRPDYEKIIVGGLLLLFLVFSVSSMAREGLTNDELAHIAASYSYITEFDFRLNPEHPPLVKLMSDVPLLFTDMKLPADWRQMDQNSVGKALLYNEDLGRNLFLARLPIVLIGLLIGFVIFIFAKGLHSKRAGYLALFLFAFSPLMIAHSHYVTTDAGITLFMLLSVYSFWRYTNDQSRKNLIYTGISLGLSLAAKFTGLYVIGILGIIGIIFALKKHKTKVSFFRSKQTWKIASALILIVAIGFSVLILTYGIKESPRYIAGLKFVVAHSSDFGHAQYLMGMHSIDGWWYYFPLAFLFKTPIPTLLLVILSIIFYRKREDDYFLFAPIAVYLFFFMTGKIDIGIRHIMPIYPFIFILISRLADHKDKILKFVIPLLCIWYAVSSLMIFPHYISYFNEAIRSDNGHKYLIDSNIDWGQGLPELKRYLDKNGIEEQIYLGYSGFDNATIHGIDWQKEHCFPQEGIHAISVNNLMNIYNEEQPCIDWILDYEPIAKVGYSIWIYDIKGDFDAEPQRYCDVFCEDGCEKAGLSFKSSTYESGCRCKCHGKKVI